MKSRRTTPRFRGCDVLPINLLLKLYALQEVVVELPVFLILNVADHKHVHLARPGKVVAVIGIRLRAALVPEVDGGGSGDLHIWHPVFTQEIVVSQPLQ